MADLQKTIEFLTPYFSTVEEVVQVMSFFVGGFIGIYIIIMILKFLTLRKIFKSHKEIIVELKRIEKKVDDLTPAKKSSKKKS